MNTSLKALIGLSVLAAATSTVSGEGLLGKRYVQFAVGSDSDLDAFAYGAGFNINLAQGIDLAVVAASSDDGDVKTGMLVLPLYSPVAGSAKTQVYLAPKIGYVNFDTYWGRSESDLIYGLGLGMEYSIDAASNIDISLSYTDTQDYGDLGFDAGVEYNRWFSESVNAGIGVSYNTEIEEVGFALTGRWAF